MLKDQPIGGGITASIGGEIRYRYIDERNRLRPPGGPGRSQHNQWRFTPYFSLSAADRLTVFAQGIDASTFGYDAPYSPAGIDVNRSDMLQAYAELKITDQLAYRYGRQFLKYGAQRLLSPLGWGNTYRNFEGHKLSLKADYWDVDAFAMESVNAAAGGVFRPTSYDVSNPDRRISGVYSTFKGFENNSVDLYWLWFENENDDPARQDGDRHTLGLRWAGSQDVGECSQVYGTWKWDIEGAYQFGHDDFGAGTNLDVNAGFVTSNFGYTATAATWSPSLTGIFYWGSGDDDPTDGEDNTVYTLYPLGHAYWGIVDNFSGQNLVDYGVRTAIQPLDNFSLSATYHWFSRASVNDAVYNIAGAPLAVGAPGEDIGTEIDFIATLNVSRALQLQVGYSWFQYGEAIDNSSPRNDAQQFYVMSTLQF